MIKQKLAKIDIEYFKWFKSKYPLWEIYRLEDNSLIFIPPQL